MKVFEALEQLKQKGPCYPEYGICSNIWLGEFDDQCEIVRNSIKAWYNYRGLCFAEWVDYSDDYAYPIPGHMQTPQDAFNNTPTEDMWNPEHPYGAARLRLLDHCINWFKERDM